MMKSCKNLDFFAEKYLPLELIRILYFIYCYLETSKQVSLAVFTKKA